MCWCLVMYLYHFLDMTLVWYVQLSHFSSISFATNCFVSFRSPHVFLRFGPLCCTQQFRALYKEGNLFETFSFRPAKVLSI